MKVSIVMSAMVSGRDTRTNLDAHFDLREDLVGLGFEPVSALGKYQGETELSYIVPCKLSDLQKFTKLAYEYEQECILVINQDDLSCRFVDTTKEVTHLLSPLESVGKWTKVTMEEITSSDINEGYTNVNGSYFKIK